MKFLTLLAAFLVVSSQLTYAQDNTEPPHGMGELEAYSVFTDAYRSDDFELAANFGEWMIHAKPEEIEGHAGFELSQQFERMVHIYAGLAEQESDPSAISAHLDSAPWKCMMKLLKHLPVMKIILTGISIKGGFIKSIRICLIMDLKAYLRTMKRLMS